MLNKLVILGLVSAFGVGLNAQNLKGWQIDVQSGMQK